MLSLNRDRGTSVRRRGGDRFEYQPITDDIKMVPTVLCQMRDRNSCSKGNALAQNRRNLNEELFTALISN